VRWTQKGVQKQTHKTKALFLVYSENEYTKGTKQRMEKNGILESFSKCFAEKTYTGIRKHTLKFCFLKLLRSVPQLQL
jgi:hypothetical protein